MIARIEVEILGSAIGKISNGTVTAR